MLGKIVVYVNEMTGKLKEDANEDDHSRIEYVMSSLMHNGLITDSAYELKVDILRISQSISVFEKQRVKKMLERMEKFEITEEEINKVILPMIQMVKSQNL
jgi:hypothetical protein